MFVISLIVFFIFLPIIVKERDTIDQTPALKRFKAPVGTMTQIGANAAVVMSVTEQESSFSRTSNENTSSQINESQISDGSDNHSGHGGTKARLMTNGPGYIY